MPVSIPAAWMPKATIRRIHIHWTAGSHKANSIDKDHYHIIVQGDGTLVRGDRPISGNSAVAPVGKRASHTRAANTGAIGVSMCCMSGAKESPFNAGPAPMTKAQWQAMIEVVAQLARHYSVPNTPKTILTHAEVEPTLGIIQKGKWDITRIAFDPTVKGHAACGKKLRAEVAAALGKTATPGTSGPIPADMKLVKFKVVGVKPDTLSFRNGPNGKVVGQLPENTVVEQLSGSGDWSQVRTPAGFVGWVHSAFLNVKE